MEGYVLNEDGYVKALAIDSASARGSDIEEIGNGFQLCRAGASLPMIAPTRVETVTICDLTIRLIFCCFIAVGVKIRA